MGDGRRPPRFHRRAGRPRGRSRRLRGADGPVRRRDPGRRRRRLHRLPRRPLRLAGGAGARRRGAIPIGGGDRQGVRRLPGGRRDRRCGPQQCRQPAPRRSLPARRRGSRLARVRRAAAAGRSRRAGAPSGAHPGRGDRRPRCPHRGHRRSCRGPCRPRRGCGRGGISAAGVPGGALGARRCPLSPRGEGCWGEGKVPTFKGAPSSGPAGHLLPEGEKEGVALLPALAIRPPAQRIALARDAAFSFVYGHLIAGWRAAGAEIVPFSPLADEPPPEDCDLCWLPGGYPELHAGRLTAATRFRDGLRAFAATRPVHGECGGYMVLGQGLIDAGGARHEMAGLLGLETSFATRKLHLGYRRAVLAADGPLGVAGGALRGHEFHYASVVGTGGDAPFAAVSDANGTDLGPAGTRRGAVSGTFFHMIGPG
ncbi:cobyrinic acid a,c-diamide synthase [Rhizobiales bacterium Sp-1]|uniref:Cobyrinic acid a,c-diamide synthase n=1 Tax=Segnochrobactrum spirostomi TaxID=2608987 RepID=A0A6A7Y2V0_9HYPH|nr:cobyrinic acid a,c-diamide synthase [Segnochrobactrum spirostomi]